MADELKYDKDGYLVYTGLSPLHEDEDIAEGEESPGDRRRRASKNS